MHAELNKHICQETKQATLHGIPSTDLQIVWKDVKPFIEDALKLGDGRWTLDSIYQSIQSKDRQLWITLDPGVKAVGITEIINYPGKKVCNMFLVAGELNFIVPFFPEFREWAKEEGCSTIELYGREGWQKVLKDSGWKRAGVILRHEA